MGANLKGLAQQLGIGGTDPNYGSPSAAQPGLGPRALLGPEAAPETVGTEDIAVTGTTPPRMTPEGMGMPGMTAMRSADPESIDDLRAQLRDKAKMARQLYHKNSEFGTDGVLRDVIGNVSDFGRRLLGFAPRYNEEKWLERQYGMSSTNPEVAAAAREQAMQYNPSKTMDYQKDLVTQQSQQANTAATIGSKDAQTQQRAAQILSGFGQGILNAGLGANPEQANVLYQRALPAIQAQLDSVYGPGKMQAPTEYDEAFLRQLSGAGYTGSNVQRERGAVLNAMTQRELGKLRSETQVRVQRMRGEAQIQAARILSDSRLSLAEKERELKMLPVEETQVTEESGSIIRPTTTRTTSKSYAPGGQPENLPVGARRKSRSTGEIQTWDGRNWN